MAEVKSLCTAEPNLIFMIVADGLLCKSIADCLTKRAKYEKLQIKIYRCEYVSVIESIVDLRFGVDFIIFAYDGRTALSVLKVEENINLVNEDYLLSGRACLVNCGGVSRNFKLTYTDAKALCKKCNLRFMTADICSEDGAKSFGKKILNLSSAISGLNSGISLFVSNDRKNLLRS